MRHCYVLLRGFQSQLIGEWIFNKNFLTVEPVGSAAPRFSTLATLDNIRGFTTKPGISFNLLCPAQGFPVPAFRYYFKIFFTNKGFLINNFRTGRIESSRIFSRFKGIFIRGIFWFEFWVIVPGSGVSRTQLQVFSKKIFF